MRLPSFRSRTGILRVVSEFVVKGSNISANMIEKGLGLTAYCETTNPQPSEFFKLLKAISNSVEPVFWPGEFMPNEIKL